MDKLEPVADNHCDGPPSLAVRRQRREIRLPKRFRDEIPQASAALPPASARDLIDTAAVASIMETGSSASSTDPTVATATAPTPKSPTHSRQILRSHRNAFGLFREYFAVNFPFHDPEELVTMSDLSDVPDPSADPANGPSFGPYPNENSFRLGEWFWCGEPQKSKKSFKELLDIISDPGFRPADVQNTRWGHIDGQLGSENDSDDLWMDEPDAGWTCTPVTISVPFHSQTPKPGTREFVIPEFYHRSIVSILRERLANIADGQHFHFEPFKLCWKPRNLPNPVRVHGELYTSTAFLDAHEELQSSPPEPGCTLPRVVAGLMFASDATHLTSFGEARLWPLYMQFCNDSKYRRSRPTLSLCNHVAYFQKVRFAGSALFKPDLTSVFSFQTISRTS